MSVSTCMMMTLFPSSHLFRTSVLCNFLTIFLLHIEYIVNRKTTGYEIKDDNSVHFDFWKDPDNVKDPDSSVSEIDMD